MRILLFTACLLSLVLPSQGWCKPKPGGGPPPWAPAHGARAKHRYQYYPGSQIYFDLDRKVYFHLSGGTWQLSASLPGGLVLGAAIAMSLDTAEPFKLQAQHVKSYPPGKYRKAAKGKKK